MRLLLDEMISPAVARGLLAGGHEAVALAETEFAGTGWPDERVLAWATEHGMTLVTYNVRDFAPLAQAWAAAGRRHAGLLLVNVRTIREGDVGSLVGALSAWAAPRRGVAFDGVEFVRRVPDRRSR